MRHHVTRLAALLVLLVCTKSFAGYYWWQYSTNGFMNGANIPPAYTTHYNYGYRPVTNQNHADTLIVFLPGTGARTDGYTDFYENAVDEGYFVIGLDYINDHDTTGMCTSNANCAGLFDQQLVTGTPNGFYDVYFGAQGSNPGMTAYNSITNRFGYYLKWLIATDASGAAQWSQFCSAFDGQGVCTTPNWSKIIIAGHSQGGMVSWWILKNKGAQKAIALSSPSNRMNTLDVVPATPEYTPFQSNTHSGDTAYATFDNGSQWAGKLRVFLSFYDPRYKPGVTVPGEPTSSNPNWVANQGKNQPGNLVDIGKHETRVSPSSSCDTASWTQWLTVSDPGDNGATHGSTAANGDDWPSSAPGFRHCVWDFLLEH